MALAYAFVIVSANFMPDRTNELNVLTATFKGSTVPYGCLWHLNTQCAKICFINLNYVHATDWIISITIFFIKYFKWSVRQLELCALTDQATFYCITQSLFHLKLAAYVHVQSIDISIRHPRFYAIYFIWNHIFQRILPRDNFKEKYF